MYSSFNPSIPWLLTRADSVNPEVNKPLKQVPLVGVAAAAQKVHQQLQFEPPPTPGESFTKSAMN